MALGHCSLMPSVVSITLLTAESGYCMAAHHVIWCKRVLRHIICMCECKNDTFHPCGVFVITSSRSRRIRHAPCAARRWGLEVSQAPWGHVAPGGVLWKDIGGLGNVLRPSAAIPRPPIGFAAGLRGQMLSDVFSRVRGGRARGWGEVKVGM